MYYSLEDLVLFTTEAWFGLYQTINISYWPWHLVAVVWSLFTAYRLFTQRQGLIKLSIAGFACLWFSSATMFHLGEYQQLSWVAAYYGYAFILQGIILLIVIGVYPAHFVHAHTYNSPHDLSHKKSAIRKNSGLFLFLFGVFVVPLLGMFEGRNWHSLDVIGIGPDSTALSTLGLIVMSIRNRIVSLILSCIPTAWLIISAATAWPMGLLQGFIALLIWILLVVWLVISQYVLPANKKA